MKKSKIIAGILSAVIALSAFAGCGNNTSSSSEEGKATTVTIGTLDLVNGDLIAQYEKWYETELGVDVKIVKFDSGKDINSALASGSIDIGQEGTSPAALAIASGIDIEVFWIGDIIGAAETLVAKNGSGITSLNSVCVDGTLQPA